MIVRTIARRFCASCTRLSLLIALSRSSSANMCACCCRALVCSDALWPRSSLRSSALCTSVPVTDVCVIRRQLALGATTTAAISNFSISCSASNCTLIDRVRYWHSVIFAQKVVFIVQCCTAASTTTATTSLLPYTFHAGYCLMAPHLPLQQSTMFSSACNSTSVLARFH
jgi:hypothetical protein